jgi:hypothetical protein
VWPAWQFQNDRNEYDRRDNHAYEANERFAERLHLCHGGGEEAAEEHPGDDGWQNLKIERFRAQDAHPVPLPKAPPQV